MTQDVRDLIADARELLGGTIRADHESEEARGVISRLADALEASLGERDAAVDTIERVRAIAERHGVKSWTEEIFAALDGAPEPEWEWEYGLIVEALGDTKPEPYPTRESAQHVIDHPEIYRKWTHDNPVTMRRRRPAGPWLPVEGRTMSEAIEAGAVRGAARVTPTREQIAMKLCAMKFPDAPCREELNCEESIGSHANDIADAILALLAELAEG